MLRSYCTVYLCGMLEAIQRPFAVYFNKLRMSNNIVY